MILVAASCKKKKNFDAWCTTNYGIQKGVQIADDLPGHSLAFSFIRSRKNVNRLKTFGLFSGRRATYPSRACPCVKTASSTSATERNDKTIIYRYWRYCFEAWFVYGETRTKKVVKFALTQSFFIFIFYLVFSSFSYLVFHT